MKNKKKIIVILSILLLLIIWFFGYLIIKTNKLSKFTSQDIITGEETQLNIPKINKVVYDYRLEKYPSRDDRYLLDAYNEKIAVESLNALCGAVIMEYINDNNSQMFILQNINYGSERPPQNLYKIDVTNLTCKKLNISSEIGDFGGYKISPDNTKIAISTETNSQIIKVLDLINDTSKTIATAKSQETFNAGWGSLSNKFVFDWIDNETIKYDTFKDVSETYATSEGLKPIISTQIVKIKFKLN